MFLAIAAGIEKLLNRLPPAECWIRQERANICKDTGLLEIQRLYNKVLLRGEKGVKKVREMPTA